MVYSRPHCSRLEHQIQLLQSVLVQPPFAGHLVLAGGNCSVHRHPPRSCRSDCCCLPRLVSVLGRVRWSTCGEVELRSLGEKCWKLLSSHFQSKLMHKSHTGVWLSQYLKSTTIHTPSLSLCLAFFLSKTRLCWH